MKKINIAGILIIFTLFFVVLTGLNISIFAILSFTNQSDLIMSMAIETVYNAAYILKNEIYKIMEKEIVTQRITDAIEKSIEDIKKLSIENKLIENELNKKNREIKIDIERQLRSGEIAITAAEIVRLPSNVKKDIIPNTIKDFIVNKNIMITRFKIFSTNDRAAISFWGYEQEDKLLLSIPSKTVVEFINTNENITEKINPSQLTIIMNELSSLSDTETERNYILKFYDENYNLLYSELSLEDSEKLSKVFQKTIHNIILKNYQINEKTSNYELKKKTPTKEEDLINILKPVGLIEQIIPEEAYYIYDSEIQKSIEAITSSSIGGKLFVNEDLIDYKYMDIYIPIGDLIIKARIQLPDTRSQYNTLLRLVLIAGGVIIIVHILFIIAAFIILIVPMRTANQSLEQQNKELDEANKIFIEELNVAKSVQEAILPDKENLPTEKVSIGTVFKSLEAVSGDYLDVLNIDAENIGILVVDVSGHGVPSALVTTMAKVSFNTHSSEHRTKTDIIFENVNKDLCKATGGSDYYCTAVLCVVNTRTYEVNYSTGGHPKFLIFRNDLPELIYKEQFERQVITNIKEEDIDFISKVYIKEKPNDKKSNYIINKAFLYEDEITSSQKVEKIKNILDNILYIEELGTRGFMIGAAPFARYQMDKTQIYKGDKIIIFSDGIIEAEGPDDTMYEYTRLKKMIIENKDKDPQTLSELIHEDVIKFREDHPQSDDISIIILEATDNPEIEEIIKEEKQDEKIIIKDEPKEKEEKQDEKIIIKDEPKEKEEKQDENIITKKEELLDLLESDTTKKYFKIGELYIDDIIEDIDKKDLL